MISYETKQQLRDVPTIVFCSWLSDVVSGDAGITVASFALAMQFRDVEPEDMLEYAIDRIRVDFRERFARAELQ